MAFNEPFTPTTSAVAARQQQQLLHSSSVAAVVNSNHSPCFSRGPKFNEAPISLPFSSRQQAVATAPQEDSTTPTIAHSSAFRLGKAVFEERKASFLTHLMPTPQLAHELRSMKHRVHEEPAPAVAAKTSRTAPIGSLHHTNVNTSDHGASLLQSEIELLPSTGRPMPIMGGVGIVFGQMRDGRIVVERVIPEGPASIVGVQSGDVLQAIDGVPALRMPFKALSCLVPGAAGTLICMTFAREVAPTSPGGHSSSPFIFSCQIRRSPSVVHPVASDPHEQLATTGPQLDFDCHRPPTAPPSSQLPAPAPLVAFVPSPLSSFQHQHDTLDLAPHICTAPSHYESRSTPVTVQHQQQRPAFIMAPMSPSPPPRTTLQHVAQMSNTRPTSSLNLPAPVIIKNASPPPAVAPPALQAGQVLLQLRDVESIIGQLQQLRTLIPELQSKVAVSQLAVAEAEAKLKAREKEKKEEGSQTVDSVVVVDKEMLQQQSNVVEQQRRLLEERVRALHAATSHTDTLASELIHYQRLFACVIPSFLVFFHIRSPVITLSCRSSEETLKQLQSANAAQQQVVDTAVSERDALTAELKQGNMQLSTRDLFSVSLLVFPCPFFSPQKLRGVRRRVQK